MNNNLSFGQRVDPENNLCELWLTHGALDWIKQQDWSDKVVWMFGAGLGDVWLAKRCKELHVVERNVEWIYKAQELAAPNGVTNLHYHHRPCNEGDVAKYDFYTNIPISVDIVINDDIMRFEVIEKALTLKRPLVLITDNWMQSYVFMCPQGEELLKYFESHIYEQSDHLDNDGINKWKTAIHFIK